MAYWNFVKRNILKSNWQNGKENAHIAKKIVGSKNSSGVRENCEQEEGEDDDLPTRPPLSTGSL